MQLAQRNANLPTAEISRMLTHPWSQLVTSYLEALMHLHRVTSCHTKSHAPHKIHCHHLNAKREQLRALLRVDSDAALPTMQLAQRNANLPTAEISRMLTHPWSKLVTSYLEALMHLHRVTSCHTKSPAPHKIHCHHLNAKREQLRALLRVDSDAALPTMQLAQRNANLPTAEISRMLTPPWSQLLAQRNANLPTAEITRMLAHPWSQLVTSYLEALMLLNKGEWMAACKEFREKHCKVMMKVLKEEAWVVPPVIGMVVTLKALSEERMGADDEAVKKGVDAKELSASAQILQDVLRNTAASKGAENEEKRAAGVAVGCIMMKVNFRLNTINNCKTVITNVDSLKIFEGAKVAHRVAYRYYTGRLAAYDEDFQKADEHLSYALQYCHREAMMNKTRILRYLIPVKMLLGHLPSDQLLSQYGLQEYKEIKDAVKDGDVGLLMRALNENQALFIQDGTYLLLEKLILAAYRRLFKKCALYHAEAVPAKASQMPLSLFLRALQLQGLDTDDAELQGIAANLIYRKYIKGYISHKSKVVVLAKTDPFPDLSTVQLGDPFAA
eukprot:gene3457-13517_t